MKKLQLLLLLLLAFTGLKAENKSHDHHVHNDIGFANTIVYNINEKSFNYGLHFHIIKGINEKWGVGAGYELIFADEKHHTVSILAKYHISEAFSFNVGPSLTFPSEEHDKYNLGVHLELVSAFELGKIHLGPMIGFGIGKEEKHLSLGLHIGLAF